MTRRELHDRRRALADQRAALLMLLADAHGRRAESPALYQALLEYEEHVVEAEALLNAAVGRP